MSDQGAYGQRSRPLLRTMLGEVLRRIRREQGRTLADVALAAKVSMPYLSELERGRKEASSEVLAAVCDALRIELTDLLSQVERGLADSAQHSSVVRLEVIRSRRHPSSPERGSGDALCLLAA